jgi:type III restriction enzyme
MLTEGWDVNTVTHVLGVRAFGTQLLCEQVVGRALRRVSYEPGSDGRLDPEYADVLGVPFDFAQSASDPVVRPPPKLTRVTALDDRASAEIRFPRIDGYGIAFPPGRLTANFTDDSKLVLRPDDVPTETLVEPIVGEGATLTLDNYERQRPKAVWYSVASYTLRRYFRDDAGAIDHSCFADLLRITESWFAGCLTCHGKTSPQMFLWGPLAQRAAEKIYRACVPQTAGAKFIRALVNPYNEWGSTRFVNFTTSKTTLYPTDPELCHVSHVVYDSDWEAAFVTAIERELRDRVFAYVKNHHLDFEVPYEFRGDRRRYRPDYILKVNDGHGAEDPLHLVVEIKGARGEQDAAKAETMRNRWLLGVNAAGKFGRWDFLELRNPDTLARDVAAHISALGAAKAA